MNREQAKQLLPIIHAFADGADVEYSCDDGRHWIGAGGPTFTAESKWRIKPKPLERWVVVDKGGDMRSPGFSTENLAIEDCKRCNESGNFAPYRVAHMREVV